jgi:putative transposase
MAYNYSMTEQRHWPHSPIHKYDEAGTYMITAGTYKKQHFLNTHEKLNFVRDSLFKIAEELGWKLQA